MEGEGGGGKIPTHFLHLEARTETILLMTYCLGLLFVLFCPSEKKLPYYNCSSWLPVQLTTLKLANSWLDVRLCLFIPVPSTPTVKTHQGQSS